MKRPCFSVIILGLFKFVVDGQYLQSPCPGVFEYQSDGAGVFGLIHLKSNGRVTSVHVRANFTVAARLPTTYVGQIEPISNDPTLQKFNQGVPLIYKVHFPVTSPLPRITSIVVNGNSLCHGPADIPGPLEYVTTISLDHTLFTKTQSSPIFINNYEPPVITHDNHFDNVNTQVFTINDVDNGDRTWNSDGFQAVIINHSRPVNEQNYPVTQAYPPKPDYNVYYPEQTTPTRRPQRPPPPLPPTPPPTLPPPPPPPQIVPTSPRLPDTSAPTSAQVECGVVTGGNERIPLIYNGQSYARGEWPWLVAIYKRKEGSLKFICSGTLVSDRHVVTAAHCMHQKSTLSTIREMVVKVGVYNLEDWGDDATVTRTLQSAAIHEKYNASTLENDVLVFTLDKAVEFTTYIRPACLWNGITDLNRIVGASGVVAGWGSSELGPSGQGEPRMVRIPIVSTSACKASKPEFHKLTSAKTLCAGDRNGAGPCLGDSGGGLYILDSGRWRLRGVVSLSLRPQNGENTCNLDEYIVFTDTAQYLDWIKSVLSKNLYDK